MDISTKELLILMSDKNDFYKGDIIDVKNSGFNWGTLECLDVFLVGSITTDLSTDELLSGVYNTTILESGDAHIDTLYKRKYYIDITKIEQSTIDALKATEWEVIPVDSLLVSR